MIGVDDGHSFFFKFVNCNAWLLDTHNGINLKFLKQFFLFFTVFDL